MALLVFLGGTSLLEVVGIDSACPKVLNDFKASIFAVDPLIVITTVPFPTYQILAFVGTRSSTKFEYSFDFQFSFHYFTRLCLVSIWKVP